MTIVATSVPTPGSPRSYSCTKKNAPDTPLSLPQPLASRRLNGAFGGFGEEVWKRWLAWDPVRMVEKYKANLKKLKLIYIDCGTRDEFNLHIGARILHSKLTKMGIRHYYEEFDDGHMNIQYRYDTSLPMIYKALS